MNGNANHDGATAAMSSEEETLLRDTLRAVFAEATSTATVTVALRELGWDEVVAESPAALMLLFEEQGRSGVATALLDVVVLDAAGLNDLNGLDAAVLYPPPEDGASLFGPVAGMVGRELSVSGVVNFEPTGLAPAIIVAPVMAPDGSPVLVKTAAAQLDQQGMGGLDPASGFRRTSGTVGPGDFEIVDFDAGVWPTAVAAGRRALSAELIGLARKNLEVAVETVTNRHQFGRPVGSFQAVRFRLAEAKVAIESAAELLLLAMRDGDLLSAATAKALAGSAANVTLRQAMQVCGAMGLTWEFPLHKGFRRAAVLDGLLGDADCLTVALGHHIAEATYLPQLEPFGN